MVLKQFKKPFRFKNFGNVKKYVKLISGSYGIQVLEDFYLKKEHIIAVTKAIKSILRKKNILFLRIFFDKIYTKKPTDVRMGRGKGNMAYKICILKKGSMLLELRSMNDYKNMKALRKASLKLPVKIHIVKKKLVW